MLLPWPGTPNASPGLTGFFASTRERRRGVRGGSADVSEDAAARP